jgi:hypothetical protein
MSIESTTPSKEAAATLAALKSAVKNTLDRKRRLGQYAVVWRDGKPALLDEAVEDRAAFYEALKNEPGYTQEADTAAKSQSGVEDNKGDYQSNNE